MASGLAAQIRGEIEQVRRQIEDEKSRARKHAQNVAVESEIAQRLRALHIRLEELERNLQQCPDASDA